VSGVGPGDPTARAAQRVLATLIDDDPEAVGARHVPDELRDLPEAALRSVRRIGGSAAAVDLDHPDIARVLVDMAVAEAVALRLTAREHEGGTVDVPRVVAEILRYVTDLSTTRHEGKSVTHGVVIAAPPPGWAVPRAPLEYPGQLATRTRTPLLFDGTYRAIVVSPSGTVVQGIGRSTLPQVSRAATGIDVFDELTGTEGSLTAAASAAFAGVGVYARADQSIWIFDAGIPLFLRRSNRWRPIAVASFARSVAELGRAEPVVAERVARAALSCSLRGSGALLAIADDDDSLAGQVPDKDRYLAHLAADDETQRDDLHRLIGPADIASPGALGNLAQLDGATIVDPRGELLAFGAIVRSTDSRAEGARVAAARALSAHVNVAMSVSQDGPITVFHRGEPVLRLL
jgi:hypothetical protein